MASDWSFDRSDQKLAESHTPHHQIFPQTFFRYLRTFILVLRTLPFCSPRSINDLEEMEKVLTFRMESIRSTAHFDLMKRNTKIQSHAFGRLGKRRQDSSRESKLKGDRWGTSYYVHRCKRQSTFSYLEPLFVYSLQPQGHLACVVCKFWPSELNAMEFIPSGDRPTPTWQLL